MSLTEFNITMELYRIGDSLYVSISSETALQMRQILITGYPQIQKV